MCMYIHNLMHMYIFNYTRIEFKKKVKLSLSKVKVKNSWICFTKTHLVILLYVSLTMTY